MTSFHAKGLRDPQPFISLPIDHPPRISSARPAKAASIRSWSSAAFKPPTGCFTTIRCGSTLRALACAAINVRKVSVAMTIALTPRFRSSMLSWKLHDEQDPQSPSASSAILYL
jgi:hypothetical protein